MNRCTYSPSQSGDVHQILNQIARFAYYKTNASSSSNLGCTLGHLFGIRVEQLAG